MAANLDAVAERLFAGVMAPLVLGGPIRPGHAIGARAALALGGERRPADRDLESARRRGRLRRARKLAPVDTLPDPSAADWALGAALHDILQSANPVFDARLRRSAAARILDLANAAIDARAVDDDRGRSALAAHVARASAGDREDATRR